MKPIDFPERNKVYGADQPEYQPLYAFTDDRTTNQRDDDGNDITVWIDPRGNTISCWSLSFWERIRLLFTGKVWVCLLSFHKPLTPSYLTTNKKEVLNENQPTEEIAETI